MAGGKPKRGRGRSGSNAGAPVKQAVGKKAIPPDKSFVLIELKGYPPAKHVQVGCRTEFLSINFRPTIDREILVGGLRVREVKDFLCRPKQPRGPRAVLEITERFGREIFRVISGALFFATIAERHNGGCVVSDQAAGADLFFECNRYGKSIHVLVHHWDGNTGNVQKGAFELVYRVGLDQFKDSVKCTCSQVRQALIEAGRSIPYAFSRTSHIVRSHFEDSIPFFHGLAGVIPDGKETRRDFALMHIGACFRRGMTTPMSGSVGEQMSNFLGGFKGDVEAADSLLSWKTAPANLIASGLFDAGSSAFMFLTDFAMTSMVRFDLSPNNPWCELPEYDETMSVADNFDITLPVFVSYNTQAKQVLDDFIQTGVEEAMAISNAINVMSTNESNLERIEMVFSRSGNPVEVGRIPNAFGQPSDVLVFSKGNQSENLSAKKREFMNMVRSLEHAVFPKMVDDMQSKKIEKEHVGDQSSRETAVALAQPSELESQDQSAASPDESISDESVHDQTSEAILFDEGSSAQAVADVPESSKAADEHVEEEEKDVAEVPLQEELEPSQNGLVDTQKQAETVAGDPLAQSIDQSVGARPPAPSHPPPPPPPDSDSESEASPIPTAPTLLKEASERKVAASPSITDVPHQAEQVAPKVEVAADIDSESEEGECITCRSKKWARRPFRGKQKVRTRISRVTPGTTLGKDRRSSKFGQDPFMQIIALNILRLIEPVYSDEGSESDEEKPTDFVQEGSEDEVAAGDTEQAAQAPSEGGRSPSKDGEQDAEQEPELRDDLVVDAESEKVESPSHSEFLVDGERQHRAPITSGSSMEKSAWV